MINQFYENYWSDKQGHLSDFKIKWPKLKRFGFEILKYGYYGRFYPIPHSIFVLAEKL